VSAQTRKRLQTCLRPANHFDAPVHRLAQVPRVDGSRNQLPIKHAKIWFFSVRLSKNSPDLFDLSKITWTYLQSCLLPPNLYHLHGALNTVVTEEPANDSFKQCPSCRKAFVWPRSIHHQEDLQGSPTSFLACNLSTSSCIERARVRESEHRTSSVYIEQLAHTKLPSLGRTMIHGW